MCEGCDKLCIKCESMMNQCQICGCDCHCGTSCMCECARCVHDKPEETEETVEDSSS
jgi:hypothetical protein